MSHAILPRLEALGDIPLQNDPFPDWDRAYAATGDCTILENAITAWKEHIDRASGDGNHPVFLANLSIWHRRKHLATKALSDLDDALQCAQAAVDAAPDHPRRSFLLINLLAMLGERISYAETREADLTRGEIVSEELVTSGIMDAPGLDQRLCYHASSNFCARVYEVNGTMDDLHTAVHCAYLAVRSTPPDSPDRSEVLNSYAVRLAQRFQETSFSFHFSENDDDHESSDLDSAIDAAQEAVDSAPTDSLERPLYAHNLGIWLGARFMLNDSWWSRQSIVKGDVVAPIWGHRLKDLDSAINAGREAVASVSQTTRHKATCLEGLGFHLGVRYLCTASLSDLDEATRFMQQALDATPENSPHFIDRQIELAMRLADKWEENADPENLRASMDMGREALRVAVNVKPDWRLSTRAIDPLTRKWLSGRYNDDMIRLSRVQDTKTASPLLRIHAGISMAHEYMRKSDWHNASLHYRHSLMLIGSLPLWALDILEKQYLLGEVAGLASTVAALELQGQEWPSTSQGEERLWNALTALEMGRGVVASTIEDERYNIHQTLRQDESNREMADRILALQKELKETSKDEDLSRHHQVRKELNEIRRTVDPRDGLFSGASYVLDRKQAQEASAHGPIVIINTSSVRCDAIILAQGGIDEVPLPRLDFHKLESYAAASQLGTREVLEWLWGAIAEPVLSKLGFTSPMADDQEKEAWRRIWWIATGILTKFPLHAAGFHLDGSNKTVMDRAVSSYASSVKSLITTRQRTVSPETTACEALLVAMENTPGCRRLAFAKKEIVEVRPLCESLDLSPIEPGHSRQGITSRFEKCRIFHFAGHGHSASVDPLQSHLILEKDGSRDLLTVAELFDINLNLEGAPFLAYLSACGTGQVKHQKFLDENTHLISGFHLVGFQNVVGTLWEVDDQVCVDMARLTYKGLNEGGMTNESMALSLHAAARSLRKSWASTQICLRGGDSNTRDVEPFDDNDVLLHWAPYVHYGG